MGSLLLIVLGLAILAYLAGSGLSRVVRVMPPSGPLRVTHGTALLRALAALGVMGLALWALSMCYPAHAQEAYCHMKWANNPVLDKAEDQALKSATWRKVEAENGTIFCVDVTHIHNWFGGPSAPVYSPIFDYPNIRLMVFFNCGKDALYMKDLTGDPTGDPIYIPPRSVMAEIGAIVCGAPRQ